MKRLLFIVVILLFSVWIGIQLQQDPGYVLIALRHWTIETTMPVALVLFLCCMMALYSMLRFYHFVLNLPRRYQQWRIKKSYIKAQANTRLGLIEFSEGSWASAKHHLMKALPSTDVPLFHYLTAARAAQEMGEYALRDQYLREAQQTMPDAKIAVELTQAQLQLANQQWEQALATLKHLQYLRPSHPYVLKLLMQLYQEIKDWLQLILLLPDLKKYKVLTPLAFEKLSQQAYLQAMQQYIANQEHHALQELFQQRPTFLKYDPLLLSAYATPLIQQQTLAEAENLLRSALPYHFHPKLITLYGKCSINKKQLLFAESLLKKHADSPELYLCLGRLCKANALWGKAKTYLEQSLELSEKIETYQELGYLLEELGELDAARQAYKKALALNP